MSKKTVEIFLKSLEWNENGEIDPKKGGNNILSFELLYPSPGKPCIATIKKLKLKDKGKIDFEDDNNPITKKPYTYSERILFKEVIYGGSEINVNMTDIQKPNKFDKFLGGILKGLYKTVFGLLTSSISNVVLGIPLDVFKGELEDLEKDPDDKIYNIGRSLTSLNSDNLPDMGGSTLIELKLYAPKDVIRKRNTYVGQAGQGGEWIIKKHKLLGSVKNCMKKDENK